MSAGETVHPIPVIMLAFFFTSTPDLDCWKLWSKTFTSKILFCQIIKINKLLDPDPPVFTHSSFSHVHPLKSHEVEDLAKIWDIFPSYILCCFRCFALWNTSNENMDTGILKGVNFVLWRWSCLIEVALHVLDREDR